MTYQTITTETIPIRVWAVGEIDLADQVFVQARNLANLPIAREWICLMPDYHVGYGMPIGGVLATEGAVVPNAGGGDIGRGGVGVKHHEERQPLPDDLVADAGNLRFVSAEIDRAAFQVGTLGGGNHFIELQRDEEGRVWIMLHSGSRNVGFRVCNHYHAHAKALVKALGIELPDVDLSYLPADSPLHDEYLAEMRWCM